MEIDTPVSKFTTRKLRLNPFAFPSNTDTYFVLLLVLIVNATLFIYSTFYFPVNTDITRATGLAYRLAYSHIYTGQQLDALPTLLTPSFQSEALWMLLGVALVFSTASMICWFFPYWTIKSGRFKPLKASNPYQVRILQYLSGLCEEIKLSSSPTFLYNLNGSTSAFAFGCMGRYYVGIDGGLVKLFKTDETTFRATMLHELSHLRNSDASKTYFTLSVWYAFIGVAVVPLIIYLIYDIAFAHNTYSQPDFLPNIGLRLLALTGFIYMIRNSVLRSREFYADVRASAWEEQLNVSGGLSRTLTGHVKEVQEGINEKSHTSFEKVLFSIQSYIKMLLGFHPRLQKRLLVLDDTSTLFAIGFGEAFLTGIVVTFALPDVFWFIDLFQILGTEWRIFVVVMFFALLISGIVVLGLWRANLVAQINGIPSRVWPLAIGLTTGLLFGQPLSFMSYYLHEGFFTDFLFLTPPDMHSHSSIVGWLGHIGSFFFLGIFLLLVLFFCLKWVVASASTWLRIATAYSSPQIFYWIGALCIAFIVGTCFESIYTLRIVVMPLFPSKVNSLSDLWLALLEMGDVMYARMILFSFTLPALVGIWAYPLASLLWQRLKVRHSAPRWMFLPPQEHVPEIVQREQVLFRPLLALLLGLTGGIVFLVIMFVLLKQGHLKNFGQAELLAVVIQATIAIIVAILTKQFGVFHGLFAAFIVGCFTSVVCFFHFGADLSDFLIIVNSGALATLPAVILVSFIAKRVSLIRQQVGTISTSV